MLKNYTCLLYLLELVDPEDPPGVAAVGADLLPEDRYQCSDLDLCSQF